MSNKIENKIEEKVKQCKNNFVCYEVMGSTLNDGTKARFNRTPEELLDWVKKALQQTREETIKECVEEILIERITYNDGKFEEHDNIYNGAIAEFITKLNNLN